MGNFRYLKRSDEQIEQPKLTSTSMFLTSDAYDSFCCDGYTRLSENPEILTACRTIADLVSNMTIYLMANSEKGDVRIKNELSRHIDINPNRYMTRKTLIFNIVMDMLLYGDGNAVAIPRTNNGLLGDIVPVAPSRVSFMDSGDGYVIYIDAKPYNPENLLHFPYNPDPESPYKGMGIRVAIKDVANNLKQAQATEKGFLESKWKPSVVVKVDGLTEEFSSKAGRKKLREEWLDSDEAGEPAMIPAEQFDIEQIRPLSLNDLAINDSMELNKKTVAAIVGVPSFVLGVGEYNEKEWNKFIKTTICSIAQILQLEMTRKLIISDKWYLKFNEFSLYSFDIATIANMLGDLYVRGVVKGNEVRDKLNLEPLDELNELIILENFIKLKDIGKQGKLNKGENDD